MSLAEEVETVEVALRRKKTRGCEHKPVAAVKSVKIAARRTVRRAHIDSIDARQRPLRARRGAAAAAAARLGIRRRAFDGASAAAR